MAALNSLRKDGSSRAECPHLQGGKMCGFYNRNSSYAAFMDSADVVSAISYYFETTAEESPEAFVRALSTKYGKPTVERRTYTNGLGNQFTAPSYAWLRGRQVLSVEEVCGEVGKHCVRIDDASKIKPAKPTI